MAQKHGYELRPPRGKQTNYTVRFYSPVQGRQIEPSCGTKDPSAAQKRAREIYLAELAREPAEPTPPKEPQALPFSNIADLYIAAQSSQLDPAYVKVLEIYYKRWAGVFPDLLGITSEGIAQQISTRLTQVQRQTVKKERSAIVKLMKWAKLKELIAALPEIPTIAEVADNSRGTQFKQRRRIKAPPYTVAEINSILELVPVWSEKQNGRNANTDGRESFPVQARFICQYDCGLRSSKVMDLLSSPEHWQPGQDYLQLSADIMKSKRPSKKPLSDRALKALEAIYRGPGLLFGKHDYRWQIQKAAAQVLPEHKAKTFCAQHFRSARITHFLAAGAPLTLAAGLADHTRVSTTAIYARAGEDFEALSAELARQSKAGTRGVKVGGKGLRA